MVFNFKQYTANNPLLREDGDNVTAADNAAYGADQEAGEPFEEEVTVSSSGVEMEEDTDNVTAADNAAYGADQEIGEPI